MASPQEADTRVKTTAPPLVEADMVRMKNKTKEALDKMPKMPVRLVARPKDQVNFETVQINGYTIQIQRGVQVEVPQLVYELLENANLI